MLQNFLSFVDLDAEIVEKGRPAVDKDVDQVDDPCDHVDHFVDEVAQVCVDGDANGYDHNRVERHNDDEDLPGAPLLAMLDD